MKLTLLAPPERRETVELPASSTLQQLKECACSWLGVAPARLRLITAGRLLSGDGASLESLRVAPDSTVHVVVSGGGGASALSGPTAPAPSSAALAGATAPLAEQPSSSPSSTAPLRGFDRLRLLGLDATEVDIIRSTYMADVEREAGPRVPAVPGETTRDHMLRMEDEWVRRQPEISEFALNIGPLLVAASRRAAAAAAGSSGARRSGSNGNREDAAMLTDGSGSGDGSDGSSDEDEDDEGASERRRARRARQLQELTGGGSSPAGASGSSPTARLGRPTLVTYADRAGNRFVGLMDASGRIGASAPLDRPGGARSSGRDVEAGLDDDEDGAGSTLTALEARRGGSSIDWTSFAFGLCIGITVGFIMLLWLPQGGFSRSFRAGLIAGIVINVTGSVWSTGNAVKQGSHAGSGGKAAEAAEPPSSGGSGEEGAAAGAGDVIVRSNELLAALSGRFVPLIG